MSLRSEQQIDQQNYFAKPKTALELSAEEEAELRGFSSSHRLLHALVARAKLVFVVGGGQDQHGDRVPVKVDQGDGW